MGRRKELPLLEKVRISDIGSEGNALARLDNLVVFVPMLVPGDVVDIRVIRKRKNYLEGRAVRFHEYSGLRTEPLCSHFGVCGGCKWQHLPYDGQLEFKERQVYDSLQRIGKVTVKGAGRIIGSPAAYRYRNKLEYSFSTRRWLTVEEVRGGGPIASEGALGFHIPGLFDKVLDIMECHLQPEPSNAIRNFVREYATANMLDYFDLRSQSGFLRNLVVRNNLSGDVMVILVAGRNEKEEIEKLLDRISENFSKVVSLFYIINTKRNDSTADLTPVLYRGHDHIVDEMNGLKFRVGPKSFYQTNSAQAAVLYGVVADFAELTGRETVYDLYTGTGTIACFVASNAARVIGLEYIDEAVEDARINSMMNGIENTVFISGDIRNVLSEDLFMKHGRPDVVITDPPRAGMHEDVVKTIMKAGPERIIYVSCNPATQARDILLMSEMYDVDRVQPVDMFPHTHHVENVVRLVRRSSA
ncbi:MAG: 23S rRNA (uracil(1939)-C(5))-methyltransferase RlmD [Bacteroidales bacterium]|nr:23S rRNA (uracil(1939)-C(5))-methyltransferase RlmD [Bacteroidales bacterium]